MGKVEDLSGRVTPPQRLNADHELAQFSCGEPSLDQWLKNRAVQNEKSGASRTYVVCVDGCIAGYYALSAGAVAHSEAPSRVKRNMPDPVPVILIGRFAIDSRFQGLGMGADLLYDAILRTMQAAEIAGIRAILVSAISENAKKFYERYGFISSTTNPQTLMITLTEAARIIAQLG